MPETYFEVRWPNGRCEHCYSPSTVVLEFLQPRAYPIEEFMAQARAALEAASERVRAKYGMACSSAFDEIRRLERKACEFGPQAVVEVMGFRVGERPR